MSQSPPHTFHYKLHEDVRKLLENIYLKKIGKNNERLNSQVLSMISDVFDGKKQQVKQNQISQLKERLETLCNSQCDQASPVKHINISKYNFQEQGDNQKDVQQMKLPKLFKTRDTSRLMDQKYQQNNEQRINRLEKTNLNSQRQQSPQTVLQQREEALKAYFNPYNETPKNINKDRNNASQDEYNQVKRQDYKRKFLQHGRQSNNPSPSNCFLNDEKFKINQNASQSFNNSPSRPQFQRNYYKNNLKQEEIQLDRSNQQLLYPQGVYVDNNSAQNINQNLKSQKRNKLIFLSSQKAEVPKNIFVNNSQTFINEFTDDVVQTKQLSTKNKSNQVNNNISKELFKQNQNKVKKNNISSQQILVELTKNQQPQTINFQNQTSDLKNKYINIKERSFSQNSNNRELNFSLILNQNNANKPQQKNSLNNSMIVMQDNNPVPNTLKQSLQDINNHNSFLRDIKSTQDYLKQHNNDIWTLIAKFNIQKEKDKKKREHQKQQELSSKIKEDLEKQIQEKQQNAKTQFMIDQEYQQINKKQLEQMNEIKQNQKQEDLYKKRMQTQFLEEQIQEKQEQSQKEKRQIEQDNLKFIQDLKKQQNDEDNQKKNQIKKQKQLYEGIKQDYFERFKRVNMNETNEDSKIAFEKKRIATYVKELESQKQLGTSNEQKQQGVDKLIMREKIKPFDEEILKDWAQQINQKQIISKLEKDQQKKMLEEYLQQCEKNEEQDLRKGIEYKVKVALNHQSIKEQIDQKMSAKMPEASNFDIQNNLSILREIDEYIKNAQE
ncbi:hypothetical protein ABPG74_012291 [Tetrahymena malaccensis]